MGEITNGYAVEQMQKNWEYKEGLKSRLIEAEALKRGYPVRRLSFDTTILTIKGQACLFKDMNGPLSSAAMNEVVDNKYLARTLVKEQDISVPESMYIKISEQDKIKECVQRVGFPIVIKPNNLARGMGVFVNVNSDERLKECLTLISSIVGNEHEKILLEKQFIGDDYRLFVVDGRVIAVSKRARANVEGDGMHTIEELIEEKNKKRLLNPSMRDYLIPKDLTQLNRLNREGKALDFVPDEGEIVVLRDESNIANGGESIDYTDTAHPDFKDIAIRAVQAIPGLHYAGIDIIAKDITEQADTSNYVLTEVEFSPGPVSVFPWIGEPIDMAGPVIDFYEKRVSKM